MSDRITWEHRGVTIVFDEKSAVFRHAQGGKYSFSLQDAKEEIDKSIRE